MKVSAIIVTRGDVGLDPVLRSLGCFPEILVWDNGIGVVGRITDRGGVWAAEKIAHVEDFAVYGRYAAIKHASHDVIYVQDDDCIVSDPQAVVDALTVPVQHPHIFGPDNGVAPLPLTEALGRWPVVCNMPQEFRHGFYSDHALVGFGAAFHRDAPKRAFDRFYVAKDPPGKNGEWGLFRRTCDVVFTGLTPRVLVDVPKTNREFASDPGRMYTTPGHGEERSRMLELVRQVRDGR